jgi:hypothetical protein
MKEKKRSHVYVGIYTMMNVACAITLLSLTILPNPVIGAMVTLSILMLILPIVFLLSASLLYIFDYSFIYFSSNVDKFSMTVASERKGYVMSLHILLSLPLGVAAAALTLKHGNPYAVLGMVITLTVVTIVTTILLHISAYCEPLDASVQPFQLVAI